MSELRLLGIRGVPEVTAGADLAGLLLAGLASTGDALRDGDLLVVASKVVAKAEGRRLRAADRDDAVAGQTVRVVAERRTPWGLTRIVESRSGPVLAAAGVDASNVDAGMVLLLPADPDASARALRARLAALTGRRLGVVVTDTLGRPWRDGQTDVAIGAAGVAVTDDLRGARDAFGNPLEVTVRALADEIAAAADLVKGKLEGVPVAVVRGLAHLVTDDDGPGAASLLRAASGDWFRFGHVEAVRTALGAPPGTVDPPSVTPEPVATRARRALAVAMSTRAVLPGTLVTATVMDVGSAVAVQLMGDDPRAAAAVAERLAVAAWGEELDGSVDDPPGHAAEHGGSLTVRLHDRCTAGDLPESSG